MSDKTPASRDERREAEAQVVAGHLPPGYTAEFHSNSDSGGSNGPTPSAADPELGQPSGESSLLLQGGDIHRALFKMDAAARGKGHRRAATFHSPREFHQDGQDGGPAMSVGDQLAVGGFRREFLRQKQGYDFMAARMPVTRNFVEFLDLYGRFAGEDLADTDEDAVSITETEETEEGAAERRPLLRHRPAPRVPAPRSANAGMVKTFFTLLKAFIGTGIMFLPKAFSNGGILFSSIAMLVVSCVTMVAFHLLLRCKRHYGGGYGEIGQAIVGPKMRALILFSIALSQLGFVCAGIVFVAENMLTFLNAVTGGHSPLSTAGLIALQLLVLVPLAWIRNISKLGPVALLADVCILFGVAYIYSFTGQALAGPGGPGIHPSVVLFNPSHYTLTIGAAIFTFEGIGLILPIQESMARPQQFEPLLGLVMALITVVFTSVGAMCYATFGAETQIEIIDNFPQDSAVVNAVQLLYAVAVLVGTPVQLFPALRIIESGLFGHRSGKGSLRTKWVKNAFRLGVVAFCGCVSVAGTGNLDRFVALIGSVACVPLVYVYPAYLHYRGVARKSWVKFGDAALIVLGIVCMVYTTTVTIAASFL